MNGKNLLFKIATFFLIAIPFFAQIKITQLPPTGVDKNNLCPDGYSPTKETIKLNNDWNVYLSEEPGKKVNVNLPLTFENADELIFEKSFSLAGNLLEKNLRLIIYGLDYSAEIILNDVTIYRHTGGGIPVICQIPTEAVNKGENLLKIIVKGKLTSNSTLPTAQRFLFPKHRAGILGDVLIETLPQLSVTNLKTITKENFKKKTAKLFCSVTLLKKENQDSSKSEKVKLKVKVCDENSNTVAQKDFNFETSAKNLEFKLNLNDVKFWSPASPHLYTIELSLWAQGKQKDFFVRQFPVFSLEKTKEGIFLNGKKFSFAGTIYSEPDIEILNGNSKKAVERDLRLIKKSGFNTVRFKYSYPKAFELNLCTKIGLLPIVEIPLQNPPEQFITDKNFVRRITEILGNVTDYYAGFGVVKIIGLGSSYLNSEKVTVDFIQKLASNVSKKRFLKFASFSDFPKQGIADLDFYGKEIYAKDFNSYFDSLRASFLRPGIFISEISYPKIYGHTSGYLNRYSVEAQAKYFTGLISRSERERTNGFLINSIFDYRGDFTSLYAGYNKENVYKIGLTNEKRDVNSYALKAVSRKLLHQKGEKILLGTKINRSPIFFILTGLILGVIMGFLFNSKRSFREDATRSLFRPYNFFADIRDHRIRSGLNTVILMLILTGIHALLLTIILYFLRMNILLEKILIAFNSPVLIRFVSFLAWHPVSAYFILWGFSILLFVLLAAIIKLGSLFVKQKVFFTNIYFVVIWAFLPLTILLPLELVLHKILLANAVNIYIYAVLFFFLLWTLKRLFMGIYIIFDVTAQAVYFYGFLFLLLLISAVTIYFQITENTYYYILTAVKEYLLI